MTAEDFEQLAMQAGQRPARQGAAADHPEFPGVKVPGVVTVIVVPDGDGAEPDPERGHAAHASARTSISARLLTTELYVVPPRYQRVEVTAEVVAEDGADLAEVKKAIDQR